MITLAVQCTNAVMTRERRQRTARVALTKDIAPRRVSHSDPFASAVGAMNKTNAICSGVESVKHAPAADATHAGVDTPATHPS